MQVVILHSDFMPVNMNILSRHCYSDYFETPLTHHPDNGHRYDDNVVWKANIYGVKCQIL